MTILSNAYHFTRRHLPLLAGLVFVSTGTVSTTSTAANPEQAGFDAYRQQVQQQFQSYRDERDKAFVDYLKKQWQEFETFKTGGFYQQPKPATLPVAPKTDPAPAGEPPIIPVPPLAQPVIPEAPKPPVLPAVTPTVPGAAPDKKAFIYFGTPLSLSFDASLQQKLETTDKEGISNFWSKMSQAPHEPLVAQIQEHTRKLQLSDWGVYLLCLKSARYIQQNHSNETTLTTWFLLSKLGYQTKIAYNGNDVFLLVAVNHPVFQRPFLADKDKKYYLMTDQAKVSMPGKLYTYPGTYPLANQAMTFNIKTPVQLNGSGQPRLLSFSYGGERYELKVTPRLVLAEHYAFLPQSDYHVYFQAAPDPAVMEELTTQLAVLLKGRTPEDSINLLLRFVQTAFDYQTDDQQFAYEKVMLPEETLYYPYSDCEDRTILFGYLVKHLLHYPVVALRYPDHLAAAVAFPAQPGADTLPFQSKTFVVTDPTYINANAGMTMPQYQKVKPEILEM